MRESGAPLLAGIHHLKLPVRDLERSRDWYERTLGYRVAMEFLEEGTLMGVAMEHGNGGPPLALRREPDKAAEAAGFDYFAFGIPDRPALEALAARLDELGEKHAGIHEASIGWILPHLYDPDGYDLRFYTHGK